MAKALILMEPSEALDELANRYPDLAPRVALVMDKHHSLGVTKLISVSPTSLVFETKEPPMALVFQIGMDSIGLFSLAKPSMKDDSFLIGVHLNVQLI